MRPIQGVILDIDGTLVDSNDAHAHAWVDAFEEAGIEVPFERVRRLIGMGSDKLMPEAANIEKESDEGKRISERRRAIFQERYLPKIQAFARTRELLLHMRDNGLKLVVASSAEAEELEHLLEIAGASDLVEETTSSDDAEASKPEPDIVQAAVKQSGLDPDQLIMVGDTPYDLEASQRAGVALVGVRSGGWPDEDFAGAIAVYQDPAELLANFALSPFAGSANARGKDGDLV
jgi:HAD superfamily hydrolase (TIGR01549 family)